VKMDVSCVVRVVLLLSFGAQSGSRTDLVSQS